MPEVTLSLPAILGLFAMFLVVGAGLVWFATSQNTSGQTALQPSPTPTITETVAPTSSPTPPTPTVTNTPEPTATPQLYSVKLGDTCGAIAYSFGVSINSIVLLNNLPADCSTLFEGQQLSIPAATPTPTAFPTATLNPTEAAIADCDKVDYTVQENDTLSSISLNYAVPMDAIREFNGLVNDTVRFGQVMVIPLCKQSLVAGPTATATLPPPYPAPNLLLPADGAPYTLADEGVTLQWASVGTLRENEAYAVAVEDVTEGQGRKLVQYVVDTKFIVPPEFRPNDNTPHVLRWSVVPVRQVGTDDDGNPIWEPAGAPSATRDFTWTGVASAATPTP